MDSGRFSMSHEQGASLWLNVLVEGAGLEPASTRYERVALTFMLPFRQARLRSTAANSTTGTGIL